MPAASRTTSNSTAAPTAAADSQAALFPRSRFRPGPYFTRAHPGHCAGCGEDIQPGDEIRDGRRGRLGAPGLLRDVRRRG